MTDKEFRAYVIKAYVTLKRAAPVRKGDLRESVVLRKKNANEYRIYIGGDLAPYAVYTNEQWVAPSWGKHRFRNPNYHWIDNAVTGIVGRISHKLNGTPSVDAIALTERLTNKNSWDTAEGQARLARYKMTFDDTLPI